MTIVFLIIGAIILFFFVVNSMMEDFRAKTRAQEREQEEKVARDRKVANSIEVNTKLLEMDLPLIPYKKMEQNIKMVKELRERERENNLELIRIREENKALLELIKEKER